jgi:hypothetical protein
MIATPILASGDSVSIDPTAADVLTATDGAISADDAGADKLLFWDDSAGKLTHLELGTALSISGTTLNASTGTQNFNYYSPSNYWIPAAAWIPRTTNGCGVDSREIGSTNRQNFDELLFDAATLEYAQALHILPSTYNNSTVTVRFYWTASSGTGGVVWGIQGRALADDDALDIAFGTAPLPTAPSNSNSTETPRMPATPSRWTPDSSASKSASPQPNESASQTF